MERDSMSNACRLNGTCFAKFLPSVLTILMVGGYGGCNRSSSNATSAEAGKSTSAAAAATTGAAAKSVDLEKPTVRIETSAGGITVRLDAIRSPGTVRNFLNYANDGFYENTLVHYVDPGKMIIAGGYSTDNKQKPARTPIRNEAHNGVKNVRGTIAMARDASLIDSATSQFFINLADAPQRDHTGDTPANYGYCVFGEVTEGLDVAEKISQSPTTDQGGDLAQTPKTPVVIKSIRVVR
jgi:cyclophilin family peptidyl-prolyl cis-trans isomerase